VSYYTPELAGCQRGISGFEEYILREGTESALLKILIPLMQGIYLPLFEGD
jgi:hypothetical protein